MYKNATRNLREENDSLKKENEQLIAKCDRLLDEFIQERQTELLLESANSRIDSLKEENNQLKSSCEAIECKIVENIDLRRENEELKIKYEEILEKSVLLAAQKREVELLLEGANFAKETLYENLKQLQEKHQNIYTEIEKIWYRNGYSFFGFKQGEELKRILEKFKASEEAAKIKFKEILNSGGPIPWDTEDHYLRQEISKYVQSIDLLELADKQTDPLIATLLLELDFYRKETNL